MPGGMSWMNSLPDLPKVILFDLALGSVVDPVEGGAELLVALEVAKNLGAVIILSSGDAAELGEQALLEQAMLLGCNITGELLRRVFLRWQQQQGTSESRHVGWLTILATTVSKQRGPAALFSFACLIARHWLQVRV